MFEALLLIKYCFKLCTLESKHFWKNEKKTIVLLKASRNGAETWIIKDAQETKLLATEIVYWRRAATMFSFEEGGGYRSKKKKKNEIRKHYY